MLRQQAEGLAHPGAERPLDQLALARSCFGQQRRRQVVHQLVVALELRGDLGGEGRVGVQARHLVLVLVGHQLEQVARHRLGSGACCCQAGLSASRTFSTQALYWPA
jgi:hypothetical protein